MKKLILVIAFFALTTGCDVGENKMERKPLSEIKKVHYCGHDYIVYSIYGGCGICHAGDCPCKSKKESEVKE